MNILNKLAVLALLDNTNAKKKCPFGYGKDIEESDEHVKAEHPRV
jgi:hypothetical protein